MPYLRCAFLLLPWSSSPATGLRRPWQPEPRNEGNRHLASIPVYTRMLLAAVTYENIQIEYSLLLLLPLTSTRVCLIFSYIQSLPQCWQDEVKTSFPPNPQWWLVRGVTGSLAVFVVLAYSGPVLFIFAPIVRRVPQARAVISFQNGPKI